MFELQKYFERSNIYIKLLTGTVLISLVAFADYITTNEISFSIFYLIPITLMAWYGGKLFGIIFAVAGAGLWLIMDTIGFTEVNNLVYSFWSTVVRFGFFIIVTVLIVKLKSLRDNQEEIINLRTKQLKNEIKEHKKSQDTLLLKSMQLSELNKKIETIKEEQNKRIAREIHDELGQSLTAINLELMWISKKHSNDPDIVIAAAREYVRRARRAQQLDKLSRVISSGASKQLTVQSKLASEDLVNKNFETLFAEECARLRAPQVALRFQGA